MKKFELLEPRSVEEACQYLSKCGDEAKVLAGGTALVKLMKKRLVHPSYLVNVKGIKDLDYIRSDKNGLKIGALTTLSDVEASPLVRERFGVVAEMAHTVGSVQIRNVGTLAGNLCFGDPASDPAPLLIALGTSLRIANLGGEKIFPLEGFFKDFYETTLGRDEVVVEIQIPPFPKDSGVVYLRHTLRVGGFDPAVVGVAVALILSNQSGICKGARIVLGGVSSTPIRLKKIEKLIEGKVLEESLIAKAALASSEGVNPMQDVRASSEYRKEMIKVFMERGIRKALRKAEEERVL
jgi:CO/xanthine dehydrogenase FAD-binding subunit